MYININTLIAVYINVSWKTSISYGEFSEYQRFLQFMFLKKGDPLKILLTENNIDLTNKQIHYIFDNNNEKIRCPENISVKESHDYLRKTLSDETFDELSNYSHKYFDYKYPKCELEHK